ALVDWRAVVAGPTSDASAVAASAPAVVNSYTERSSNPDRPTRGWGCGVAIDPRGYVVTNWHVIRDAQQIGVQLADGRVAEPKLVGTDPETELALLKIDLPDLPSIKLGRSDRLQVGEPVLAIGN